MKDISRRDFLKVMSGVAAGAFLAKSGLPKVMAQAPVVGSEDETGKKNGGRRRLPGQSVLHQTH